LLFEEHEVSGSRGGLLKFLDPDFSVAKRTTTGRLGGAAPLLLFLCFKDVSVYTGKSYLKSIIYSFTSRHGMGYFQTRNGLSTDTEWVKYRHGMGYFQTRNGLLPDIIYTCLYIN
jgi:hypothetical protein